MDIRDLLAERKSLWDKAKKFFDEHVGADGTMSREDAKKFDKMEAEIEGMTRTIDAHKKLESWDLEMAKPLNERRVYEQPYNPFANSGTTKGNINGKEYRENFMKAFRDRFSRANDYLRVGELSDGGYLCPTEFNDAIVSKLQEDNVLRQVCKVITTASTHQIPVIATQPAASWIGEGDTVTFSNASFGQVTLDAHKLAVALLVSNELLQDSYYGLENFLIEEFGRAFARAEEESFLNGDGTNNQPLGLLPTLAQSATSTLQTTGAEISADDLITLMYSVDRPYRANASWLINDSTLANIRRLKDSTQNFLWQPSLTEGEPPQLLGHRVYTSSFMPPTASGNTCVLFGDFSRVVIGERGNRQVRPLRELYAMSDKTAFLMLERVDVALTDRHAIRGLAIR